MAPVSNHALDDGGFSGLDGLDGVPGGHADAEDDLFPTFDDLTPFEVEHFVQGLQEFPLDQVGDSKWLTQHEHVEKLNWTAHNQAKEGYDEYVIDQLNTLQKLPTLIYDLILIEVWKQWIWPLVKEKIAKFSSLRTYIPVYHEASLANLLEICLFHRTSCEEAGDALIDLVDYCVRKLRHLLATPNDQLVRQVASAKECADWDGVRVLDEQFCECEFQVCMCTISIVRFITDHRAAVPLAVTTRLLETHDVLLLLVPLMEKAPWVRRNRANGRLEKFEEHRWQAVEADDEGRLPKLHSQLWLAIYNLVMDGECRARYELTTLRRENLLRLRRFINEVVVDQLPPLTNLHRTLEELAISGRFTGAEATPAPFVVELVAELRESLVRQHEGRWALVAEHQLREVLVKETPEELKRLGNMISVPRDLFASPAPTPAVEAWEAVFELPLVRATASFFAAARLAPEEAVVLSAPPQAQEAGRLRLELRRRSGLAPLDSGSEFRLTAPGLPARPVPFVSQRGAARAPEELRALLQRPEREALLRMYCEDVAEFCVEVGTTGGLDPRHVEALGLVTPP